MASLADSPIYPCTPLAVVRALQLQGMYDASATSGSRLAGKVISIINR
jgi:5,10-methylene-tetrahydrofolate dehydrogenase/methenyl tetrahydrofolate cyclohydrolase